MPKPPPAFGGEQVQSVLERSVQSRQHSSFHHLALMHSSAVLHAPKECAAFFAAVRGAAGSSPLTTTMTTSSSEGDSEGACFIILQSPTAVEKAVYSQVKSGYC